MHIYTHQPQLRIGRSKSSSRRLLQAAQETYHLTFKTEQLDIGNYHIFPDTVIERKTVNDFCISIIDGRLFQQSYRLTQFAENPILLIEGKTFANRKYDIIIDAVKGAFITLAQTFHIPILRSRDEAESAWYINCLLQQRRRLGQQSGVLSQFTPETIKFPKAASITQPTGYWTEISRTTA